MRDYHLAKLWRSLVIWIYFSEGWGWDHPESVDFTLIQILNKRSWSCIQVNSVKIISWLPTKWLWNSIRHKFPNTYEHKCKLMITEHILTKLHKWHNPSTLQCEIKQNDFWGSWMKPLRAFPHILPQTFIEPHAKAQGCYNKRRRQASYWEWRMQSWARPWGR